MGKVIVVASGKGGTGKTTTAAAVGSCLSTLGYRTLCVDCDTGLRNLDITLGMTECIVTDFMDVLDGRMEQLLDKLWAYEIVSGAFKLKIPTGLLIASALFCFMLWCFMRSRTGLAMTICGANPRFAQASGLNVNRYRLIGVVVSSAMGAVGIIIYSQSYGFIQLYQAPLYMALYSVSAILIGGASLNRATIGQALIGTFLFNSLLVVTPAVANRIIESEIAEIMRLIISNGIILYALTRKAPGGELG